MLRNMGRNAKFDDMVLDRVFDLGASRSSSICAHLPAAEVTTQVRFALTLIPCKVPPLPPHTPRTLTILQTPLTHPTTQVRPVHQPPRRNGGSTSPSTTPGHPSSARAISQRLELRPGTPIAGAL